MKLRNQVSEVNSCHLDLLFSLHTKLEALGFFSYFVLRVELPFLMEAHSSCFLLHLYPESPLVLNPVLLILLDLRSVQMDNDEKKILQLN